MLVIKYEVIILCDHYPVVVSFYKIFEYLQYLRLIIMLHKVFSLSFYIAPSKKEYIDESESIKKACSNQPKGAIISSNSIKDPKAKISIA